MITEAWLAKVWKGKVLHPEKKKKKSTFIHLEAIYIQEVFSPYQSMSGVMCSEYDKDWIYLTISLGLPCRNVMISSAYH